MAGRFQTSGNRWMARVFRSVEIFSRSGLRVLCSFFISGLVWGCFSTGGHPTDSSEDGVEKSAQDFSTPKAGSASSSAASDSQNSKAPQSQGAFPECLEVAGIKSELPYYVKSLAVVVTRFAKPCSPKGGGVGIETNSQWLAMGFPCTGGGGRVTVRGKYHNPNGVSFVLGTECAMVPAHKDEIHKILTDKIGLPATTPMMAYLPFVVQYWEVVGHQDADTGFSIDLKSPPALEGVWKNFRENQPFAVRLYGRENSWVPGGHFYQVDATLHYEARTSFRLTVQNVKKLEAAETAKVRERCEMLRPQRHCSAVF